MDLDLSSELSVSNNVVVSQLSTDDDDDDDDYDNNDDDDNATAPANNSGDDDNVMEVDDVSGSRSDEELHENDVEVDDVPGSRVDEESHENEVEPSTRNEEVIDISEEVADAGAQCMICYDPYSNSGEHRLACLKCGHLFGYTCIVHWLKVGCNYAARRCPACNKRAAMRDIRILYARNITASDTTEITRLQQQINSITTEKNKIEAKLHHSTLKLDLQEKKIINLRTEISVLQDKLMQERLNAEHPTVKNEFGKVIEINDISLSQDGGCRVLAYSRELSLLVASQSSGNPLFSGFGIKKINTCDLRPCNFFLIHKKAIRDMVFHGFVQNLLLTASIEGCAKLFDSHNNTVVSTFAASSPLWSCCWSQNEPYKFYCGSQTGIVYGYDQRRTDSEVEITMNNNTDKTGVIALSSVMSKPGRALSTGGIIACKLNCVYACEFNNNSTTHLLPIEGNFTSMRYDLANDHILLSTRPGSRWPSTRHMVYRLSHDNSLQLCEPVHTFYGSRVSSSVLSRSAFVRDSKEREMLAAHNTANGTIDMWDLSTTDKIPVNIQISEPILDICSFNNNNDLFLPCLSDKKLSMVKICS